MKGNIKMKKIFGIILCAVMIIAAAVPAYAAVRSFIAADLVDGKLNIVVDGGLEKLEACAGDTVDVQITFKKNKTISSAKILLTFDKNLSVVTEKDKNENIVPKVKFDIDTKQTDGSEQTWATLYADKNQLLLNWLTSLGEVKGDVVYATVTFKVSDKAEVGKLLAVTAEADAEDIYDKDVKNTAFNIVDGGVTVIEKTVETDTETDNGTDTEPGTDTDITTDTEPTSDTEPESDTEPIGTDTEPKEVLKGDCDGNGEVNNKDVVTLFRYVSGNDKVEDESAYDFNGDKEVNNKDVVELFRYVSQ